MCPTNLGEFHFEDILKLRERRLPTAGGRVGKPVRIGESHPGSPLQDPRGQLIDNIANIIDGGLDDLVDRKAASRRGTANESHALQPSHRMRSPR